MTDDLLTTPAWLPHGHNGRYQPEELLDLSIRIASASALHGGGPFGAVISNTDGCVVALGWNRVVASCDSTAHAEVVALRRAQRVLKNHNLSAAPGAPFALWTSCAPCIQCYGAIYWSGLAAVTAAAPSLLAEQAGFDEGPVTVALWEIARDKKGIAYSLFLLPLQVVQQPFQDFRSSAGRLY